MGQLDLADVLPLLVCPRCRGGLVSVEQGYRCMNPACPHAAEKGFGLVGAHPVLVDFAHSIMTAEKVFGSGGASAVARRSYGGLKKKIRRLIAPPSPVTIQTIARLLVLAKQTPARPTVLVVGGGTVGSGAEALYADPAVQVIAFDLYGTPLTQFIADAHQIPLRDQCVDAVVVQAVLHHVLDPWQVVAEIHRVLRPGGLVYAETAFMQQVCEGPYDFVRFTESGHRYLFRKFELVESGVVAGPGTQLLWTLDHTARCFFRSRVAGLFMKALVFWVRCLDWLSAPAYAVDNASCVFFLGRRAEREMSPREVIGHYKGAQRPPSGTQS